MTTIYEILEQNDTRCMDSEEDRVALARALRIGLVHELRAEAANAGDASYGVRFAALHIHGMSDGPDHKLVTHLNEQTDPEE